MKKTTLNYVLGFVFCFLSVSAFSQDNENVIILEMPSENTQVAATPTKVTPSETVNSTETKPIYIADGVVIKNLNMLDPNTIISVDVLDNKIIITTNRAAKNTSEPTLAANI